MTTRLPANANLKQLRHQAKDVLKAHKSGDASSCEILRHLHQCKDKPDEEVLAGKVSLAEVQFALAMKHGFQSWVEMKEYVESEGRFSSLVDEVVQSFKAKGPSDGTTGTEWEGEQRKTMGKLLRMGSEGTRVASEMARTPHGRVKRAAAFFFGHSDSDCAPDELRLLMRDESVGVRLDALRAYARLLHPDGPDKILWGWTLAKPASALPLGVESIIEMLGDDNYRVRNEAVCALGAYRRLHDAGVDAAFKRALADKKHKVRHSAARILDMTCPACGESLKLSRYLPE